MNAHHPHVSEHHEGSPWFEWCVAGLVVAATVLAIMGEPMVATAIVSVTAIGSGVVRLIYRERSPWKVRSVSFDAVCGIGFGVVLTLLYLAIRFIR